MSLLNELKRRNVLRVGAAYAVTAWLVIQVVETVFPFYGFSDASIRFVFSALAVGLIPVLIFSWAFEWLDKISDLPGWLVRNEPYFRVLHDDPRWQRYVDSLD